MAKVTFREDRCKGCSLCVEACPKKIIYLEQDRLNTKGYNPAVIKDMDKCIACAMCARICPDCVIEIEK